MNKRLKFIIIASFTIIFFFGIFIGINLPPIAESNFSNSNHVEDKFTEINLVDFVNFESESDIIKKRHELIHFIWKTDQLPNDHPNTIESDFLDVRFNDLQNLNKINKITINMKNDFSASVYLFLPKQSNEKLIIYYHGHSGGFIEGKQTIQKLLISGFSVAAFSMPLIEPNNQPIVKLDNIGPIKFFKHGQLDLLESKDFSSISYFFTPINITLNHISKNYSFTDYYMVGISGGGWASTVYPAIDTRISKSFAVAGSLPLTLRTQIDDVGDYEQYHPQLYSIANYFELYIMSSYGQNREFVQIFNKHDPCCFAGNLYESYYQSTENIIAKLKHGKFTIVLDDTHYRHDISDFAKDLIIEKINN